ncbi:hypothetical protein BD310DRAFT_566772 [Dichomitus squalens]|uniref:Uncharacterized protein n=1 Tax=Dichomitus squalens TaxID=114155 RepID=A0A4Q9PS60_9APHY|nr:hypothetical protein BD310DRAFT_566772 [Dichomitus squalens]
MAHNLVLGRLFRSAIYVRYGLKGQKAPAARGPHDEGARRTARTRIVPTKKAPRGRHLPTHGGLGSPQARQVGYSVTTTSGGVSSAPRRCPQPPLAKMTRKRRLAGEGMSRRTSRNLSRARSLGPAFEHKHGSLITLPPDPDSESEQESAMDFLHDHHDQHDDDADAEAEVEGESGSRSTSTHKRRKRGVARARAPQRHPRQVCCQCMTLPSRRLHKPLKRWPAGSPALRDTRPPRQ